MLFFYRVLVVQMELLVPPANLVILAEWVSTYTGHSFNNGIYSKFKNVRKLKNVRSSKASLLPDPDLVAIVTSDIL